MERGECEFPATDCFLWIILWCLFSITKAQWKGPLMINQCVIGSGLVHHNSCAFNSLFSSKCGKDDVKTIEKGFRLLTVKGAHHQITNNNWEQRKQLMTLQLDERISIQWNASSLIILLEVLPKDFNHIIQYWNGSIYSMPLTLIPLCVFSMIIKPNIVHTTCSTGRYHSREWKFAKILNVMLL